MNYHFKDLETIYEEMMAPVNTQPVSTKAAIVLDEPEAAEEEPQIDLTDFKTEAQIADDIIKEMKILRRKVGKDSYYRASKILRLAEKLKAMHPEKAALS